MKRAVHVIVAAVCIALIATGCMRPEPDDGYIAVVNAFMDALIVKDFDTMYHFVSDDSARETPKDVFANRYKNIYGSVEAKNIVVVVDGVDAPKNGSRRVRFTMVMETVAGELTVENFVDVKKDKGGEYLLIWGPHVIFPGLSAERPVRVDKTKSKMGSIYDRDGRLLAGDGEVKAVGIVVEKLDDQHREEDIARIAGLLSMSPEALNEKLDAAWIKEGFVVPVAELTSTDAETKDQLLKIPGVRVDDKKGRVYPYGREFSQEEKYLDILKGTDGRRIVITDASGHVLYTLKDSPAVDGESVTLDISAEEKDS